MTVSKRSVTDFLLSNDKISGSVDSPWKTQKKLCWIRKHNKIEQKKYGLSYEDDNSEQPYVQEVRDDLN